MIQNQISTFTNYNRYPDIFKEISNITPSTNKILSFGCSTGEECETLQELYFPNVNIVGLDINKKIINNNNIKKNKYKNIEYYSDIKDISGNFDLIVANSVMCIWPEQYNNIYKFETFEKTLKVIDSLLNKNGYLCIYNSKYLFCETELFNNKYEKVKTLYNDTGFVTKYHKNNNKIDYKYPFFLFKKKSD